MGALVARAALGCVLFALGYIVGHSVGVRVGFHAGASQLLTRVLRHEGGPEIIAAVWAEVESE